MPFLVYLPTLTGAFYYDDNVIFLGHQAKRLAENPFLVFRSDLHFLPGAARSLHVFFLLVLYKVFGPAPLPYHLFNLLFHSATTLIVFIFLRRITSGLRVALLGGLIFGLHPVHVENITFVTLGGTDLFYAFWAMLSLLLYVLFSDRVFKGRKNLILLVLSVASYLFSVLSKESAAAFVLVYPLTEWFMGSRTHAEGSPTPAEGSRVVSKLRYLWAMPYLLVLVIMKRGFLFGSAATAVEGMSSGTEGGRGLGDVVLSLAFFIKSLVVPYPLSPFIREFGNEPLLYFFLILSGTAVITVIAMKKWLAERRLIIWGSLFFLVTSFPYLFVPFVQGNVAITAERYIYAASIGFSAVLACVFAGIWRERITRLLVAALLVAYGITGVVYFYEAWRTEEAFWGYVVRMNPDYVSGYVSLGGLELEKGNRKEARARILEGLNKPKGMPAEFAQAAYILGTMAQEEGLLQQAEKYYMLSLNYSAYEFSFIELGFLYLNSRNLDGARWAFESALQFPQQNLRAVLGIAKTFELSGDKEKARSYAERVYREARDERLRALAADMLR